MDRTVQERISERTISESDLRSEITRLEGVTEPPQFWISIANDPTYSPTHRAIAICQLFERHLTKAMQIVDLARLLNLNSSVNPTPLRGLGEPQA